MWSCYSFVFRSGSEEDYTDIQQYLQDFAIAKAEEMKTATQNEDKRKGEEMRKAAMKGISSKKHVQSCK